MASNLVKNRIVIEIAHECLQLSRNGFSNVGLNRKMGTFPDVYVTALDTNNCVDYLVGITGRAETKDNGDWDPLFNLVRTEDDRKRAKALAEGMNKAMAFVAIALRKADYSYAAYFGEWASLGFSRSIPMLTSERSKYRQLAPYTKDTRVATFFS
jgi:hypothetical protein